MTVMSAATVDRIRLEAKQMHFGRTVLLVIAAVLFAAGWLVAKVFGVVWLGFTWAAAAAKVGWQSAREKPGPI